MPKVYVTVMGNIETLNQSPQFKPLLFQITTTVLMAVLWSWQQEGFWVCFKAVILGGLIAAVASFYFHWRANQFSFEPEGPKGELAANKILSDVQWANTSKLLLSGLLIIAVFKYGGDNIDKAKLIITYTVISVVGVISNTYYLKNRE
tara:strand:- start:1156 stop:1599 length:444 start_codon:yes stop_codon:yes gene_type:complete